MRKNGPQFLSSHLPTTNDITFIYISSLILAVIMTIASVAGLVSPISSYPTDDLRQAFVPNDAVNLIIGLPILLGSMWLTMRGRLVGLLCWPGALFFVLYNYLAYVFAMPLNWMFLLHLALVMLSLYTLVSLVTSIDGKTIQQRLTNAVPERAAGGILAGLGLLFFVRVIGVIVTALTGGTFLPETELAANISDFLITPAWMIGGILLWRRKEFGYVCGLGLLFQASLLFVALIIFLLLQPYFTGTSLAMTDVMAVFIMGLICFAPFVFFLRGIVAER